MISTKKGKVTGVYLSDTMDRDMFSEYAVLEAEKPKYHHLKQPLIVSVTNTTSNKIEDFELFNAKTNVWKDNCGIAEGVNVNYRVPNWNYKEVLGYLLSNKHEIVTTYIESENINQLKTSLCISKSTPSGRSVHDLEILDLNNKNYTIGRHGTGVLTKTFEIKSSTTICFGLEPNTTVTFYFYEKR